MNGSDSIPKARLIIIGAGGFGREVLQWSLDAQSSGAPWRVAGFLDANPRALDRFNLAFAVLGDPAGYQPGPDDLFVGAIGDPATRLRLCDPLADRGGRFISLVHPRATVAATARLGDGCIVCPGAVVSDHAVLGRYVVVNMLATVGHDALLGDGSTLSCHADVTGAARLGRGVLLGSHASVLPRVEVGDFAVIGAGSTAYRNVPAGATVIGVPARAFAAIDGPGAETPPQRPSAS